MFARLRRRSKPTVAKCRECGEPATFTAAWPETPHLSANYCDTHIKLVRSIPGAKVTRLEESC